MLVVAYALPVEEPTVNPLKVIAPADAPLVTRMSMAQSLEGAASVCAPLLV